MAVAWPITVPAGALADAYVERPGSQVIATQMDTGPAKRRRRTTAAPEPLDVTLTLTPAELADWRAWYDGPLQGGALAFFFVHPRTQSTVTCRMRGEAQPEIRSVPNMRGTLWHVALQLEVVP